MNLKRNALAVAFAAVAALGLAGCDNHNAAQQQPQQPAPVAQQQQQQPQQAAPVQAPVAQPAVKKGDTPEEKQAKINKLEATDKARLETMGYKVLAAIGMGTCNADGTDLKDSGWHGNSTSIQYSILENDGTHAKVCVEHHNFVPTVRNPVPLR